MTSNYVLHEKKIAKLFAKCLQIKKSDCIFAKEMKQTRYD